MHESTFLIMAALAGPPLHGYALIQEVAALSRERVRLRPGTLYGALDRLAGEGLVEVDREEVVDSRLRRYYRLTSAGAGALAAEADRMRENAEAAAARLGSQGAAAAAMPGSGARGTGVRRAPGAVTA